MAINPYGDFSFSNLLQGVQIPGMQQSQVMPPVPGQNAAAVPIQNPPTAPQPSQPLPTNTSPTRTAPQTTTPTSTAVPRAPAPTQPPPSSAQQWAAQPAPAPAPTWRNTEDSWINFLGTQGLKGTRPGFFGQGANTVPDMVARFNKMTNQNATYVGGPSGDLVDFHDGRGPVDVRTAQGEFWYSEPGQGGPARPAGPAAPAIPGGERPVDGFRVPGTNTGGGPRVTPTNDPTVQKLIDMLMQRAGQSLKLDPNDPIIRGQADAYNADLERQRQRYLRDEAERAGPYGDTSQQARLTAESVGQQSAAQKAGLMGQELTARRQEIQNALSGAAGMLTSQQQMALHKELAMIEDATRRLGISTQAGLAGRGLDQDWQRALLQNEQFMNQLGLQAEDRSNYWRAVESGLIGG